MRSRPDGASWRWPALALKVYNADAASFNVNAVLVSGANDAVLVDTGFTRADAHRIAAMVLDSKKKLTTIYISQADPDFYFGAAVLKQVFPDAKLIASAATVKKIEATLATKLAVWGPRMGANPPVNPPLLEAKAGNMITLKGRPLEVRVLDDLIAKAANAAALIDAMKAAYPNAGLMVALGIGAKVNKGEMKW